MAVSPSIRNGVKWLLAGNVGGQILQFGFGVLLARLLMPADFGLLVMVQMITGLAGFIAGGGMAQALVQSKEVESTDYHVIFTAQLVVGICIYSLLFFSAPWLAEFFKNPLYADLLRVSAITFILRPFANVPQAKLHREMRFKARATISLSILVTSSACSIALASLGFGVWSLILGGLAGSLANILLSSAVATWRPALRFNYSVVRRLGAYGLKSSGNELVHYLKSQTANYVTSRALGPVGVGLFNKADSLAEMPIATISAAVHQPVFRALAAAQDRIEEARRIYTKTLMLVTVYVLPLYVALWWLAEPFIRVVYGEKWLGVVEPLRILALTGLFRCLINQSGAATEALNQLGREFFITVESFVVVVVACVIGVNWGVTGLAWALVFSYAYTTVRMLTLALKCVHGTYRDLIHALKPSILLNSVLACIFFCVDNLMFNSGGGGHPTIYLLGMTIIGATVYIAGFLFLPIKELAAEATQWKVRLRIIG